MINTFFRLIIFLFAIVFSSCRDPNTPRYSRERPSLKEIVGIKFVEVRRTFDTGLSFNQEGFQVYPERRFYLLSEDSIRTWSPDRDRYYNFKINFDHDSVFNMHEE